MMIIKMYVTLMPVIFAGIFNMLFVKTSLYRRLKAPIDRGKCLADGRRIFGDNKTWIGFVGMIVSNMISQILWGFVCQAWLGSWNYIYEYHENTWMFNLVIGGIFGLVYMVSELPNSFIKRRLDIPDGKTVSGKKGHIFFVVDQVDSLFGVVLVLAALYLMPWWQYWLYILLGGGTHIGVNLVLYKLKIRKNL